MDNVIDWEQNDGVVIITMNDPRQRVNTMNDRFVDALEATVKRLEAEVDQITGVVLTSAKDTFFAGGDLNELFMMNSDTTREAAEFVNRAKGLMRRIEKLDAPVVAALNGTALGGGLELSLACNHRVAVDRPDARFGTPEVTLGLLPGGGGIVRLVRMMGLRPALETFLLNGRALNAARAKEAGVIDSLVETQAELIPAAVDWIRTGPQPHQPWDRDGSVIPGDVPSTLGELRAQLPQLDSGAPYDAQEHIVAAAFESVSQDIDGALANETDHFVELVCNSAQAKNMMQAFFFDMQHASSGGARPAGVPRASFERVAIVGAGMMGSGITYTSAAAGMDVYLVDTTVERAQNGKAYSEKVVKQKVDRGQISAEDGRALIDRITPTAQYEDVAGCELVVEAVFESFPLKQEVFGDLEKHMGADSLFTSNTSTLPITDLAESIGRPERFVGLHFFSPVDKMPLVEVIVGKKTSDEALAHAIDYVTQMKMTPIVVNDARGFFTSRVIIARFTEAFAMVLEGVPAAAVERAGVHAGYPVGPLQLSDEVGLNLQRSVEREARLAAEAEGIDRPTHPGWELLDAMLERFDRLGRLHGAGFYDYEDGRRLGLWPKLDTEFSGPGADMPFEDIEERILFAEVLEAVRCFDEGVIESAADANVGSILGLAFPRWTGGVAQYIDGYPGGGLPAFVARANELADKYTERLRPSPSLIKLAEAGRSFREFGDVASAA